MDDLQIISIDHLWPTLIWLVLTNGSHGSPGAGKWLQQLHYHSSNIRLLIPTKYDTNTVKMFKKKIYIYKYIYIFFMNEGKIIFFHTNIKVLVIHLVHARYGKHWVSGAD